MTNGIMVVDSIVQGNDFVKKYYGDMLEGVAKYLKVKRWVKTGTMLQIPNNVENQSASMITSAIMKTWKC
ncbi:transposase [Sesbania bispinosa]|nr:transposase [Sesbania bispinosa]